MKTFLAILLSLLCVQDAQAQVSFKGTVVNSRTNLPVEYASVSITNEDGFESHQITDPKGQFEVMLRSGASYTFSIAMIGYKNLEQVLSSDSVANFTFKLIEEAYNIQVVTLSIARARENAPSTQTTLKRHELQSLDQSKDLPFLMNLTPATVISSDAGNGVGYTGIRVRGIDPTRVNVTINDIPLNDAESQGVYWVDLPDLSSSTNSIQIQRGVGTSTNGAAAFGASINVVTDITEAEPTLTANLAYGAFNTQRLTLIAFTPINQYWSASGRLSRISSDGFIDRAQSSLLSGHINLNRTTQKNSFKINALLGHERTYQAWWGIPEPKFMEDANELNRYINGLWISGAALENLESSASNTYNYYTYENEVDNYGQHHLQMHYTHFFNNNMSFKTAGHYTRGKGYFEQYIPQEDLSIYGIGPYVTQSDTFYYADLVRRRWLDNHFYGAMTNFSYVNHKWDIASGLALNQYLGNHFGEAISTEFTEYESLNAEYYRDDATKTDGNIYTKASFRSKHFTTYADGQLRYINYQFNGFDETGKFGPQLAEYLFFNPKIGAIAYFKRFTFMGMAAIGNREPIRDDFVNSTAVSRPKSERLIDYEFTAKYNLSDLVVSVTAYHMQYQNALVLNGQINDVGAYTRVNIDESYRQGVEAEFSHRLNSKIEWGGNLALAKTNIASFTEYIDDWDGTNNWEAMSIEYTNTSLAFSPDAIGTILASFELHKGLKLQMNAKYVGEQYLDNTSNEGRKLDAFTTVNSQLTYTTKGNERWKDLSFALYLNNITNAQYAPNGYTFSGLIGGERQSFNYLYPMAGFNWMLKASVKI